MKNKIAKILTFLVVATLAVTTMTACSTEVHTHAYDSSKWASNDEYHWHASTCGHNGKQADKAVHTLKATETHEDATCTTAGYTDYECEVCHKIVRVTIPALGHDVVHATDSDGETYETCTRCDYKTVTEDGHKYAEHIWEYDEEKHWHPAVCGHDNLKYDESVHAPSENGLCECGYGIKFKFSRNRTGYTFEGYEAATTKKVAVPDSYEGRPVNEIAAYVFEGNTDVEEVTLPASITKIGREAFRGCESLTTLTLSEGLTRIEPSAFEGCVSLESVVLPSTLTYLGAYAFQGCTELEEINLPAGLSTMGEQAFSGCESLLAIDIPAGIKLIENNMFHNCTSLSSVTLHTGLTDIGTQVFAGCTSLTEITLPSGLSYVGQYAFKRSGLTSISLPSTVNYLGAYAFNDCTSLTTAVLSANIDYTYGDWFSGCESLEEVTLPFVGSGKNKDKTMFAAFGYAFGTTNKGEDKYQAVTQCGYTYYIPKSLTKVTVLGGHVAAGAFNGCTNITSITLNSGVTQDDGAFDGCDATIS